MNRFDNSSLRAVFPAPIQKMDHADLQRHAAQLRAEVLAEALRLLSNRIAATLNPGGSFARATPAS